MKGILSGSASPKYVSRVESLVVLNNGLAEEAELDGTKGI